MSDDKNPEQQPGANPDEPADDTTTAGESAANESTASDSTASTRRIVHTAPCAGDFATRAPIARMTRRCTLPAAPESR